MSARPPRHSFLGGGFLYIAGSAFAFSIMTSLVKVAGQRLPSQEVVLARALVSLALSWMLLRRAGVSPWGTHRALLALRGLLGFLALSCVFHAVTALPLADATVIQYLYPTFTALLATLLLAERPSRRTIGAGVAGLAGVALVAKPAFLFGSLAHAPAPIDVAIAVGGAFFTSLAYVVVKKLSVLEDPLVIVFYFPLITVPATLPTVWSNFVAPRGLEWLVLLGVGLATQFGQVWLTRGLQAETATRATSLTYMQVVFAACWGALFFGERPDALSAAGALLVMSGAFATAWRGLEAEKL